MSYNPRTTDKYVKVKKQTEKAPENEIRIRAVPRIGRYISYAATLLLEKKLSHVVIKASGNATKSACQIAEILRHRILGLHQLNLLKTVGVVDEYEPKEEGLDKVTVERKLAVLEIHLSLQADAFKTTDPGYQAPLPKEEVQEEELKSLLEGGRRGGDRAEKGARRGQRRGPPRRGRYSGARGGKSGSRGDRGDREDKGPRSTK
jgi:Alba.